MEFDIYDKMRGVFLSTDARRSLLNGYPFIVSVPVLFAGKLQQQKELVSFLKNSLYISTNALEKLREFCIRRNLSAEQVMRETNAERLAEGIYIKVEDEGLVKERYKYVRSSFLASILNSESHWLERPIVPNMLQDGLDLFTV
jgi:hypothetical protein